MSTLPDAPDQSCSRDVPRILNRHLLTGSSIVAWRKSSSELARAFDAALPRDGQVERRTMFGYPAAFVNGNMFAGLHQEDVLIRLPEGERSVLLECGGRVWEPTPGR